MEINNHRKKITIIGSGFVGSTCAHWASQRELGDIVLLDINEGSAKGKALDLFESSPVFGSDSKVVGTSDYKDTKDSSLVIITCGLSRKPGMSRDDLLKTNADIMKDVCKNIKSQSPHSFVIVVTNPLDAMAWVCKRELGFSRSRVIGMAGILDSARFRSFISEKANVSVKDVHAFVLGGHGDTMVPMPRHCSIGGIPLTEYLDEKTIDELVERTRKGGAEIVGLLKTGSAYYAPSASVIQMAESILFDQKRILPCAAYLEGEYGVQGIFLGVLCKLGKNGLEEVIEIELNEKERSNLDVSIKAVKDLISKIQ